MKVTVCELNPGDDARDEDLKALKAHISENGTDFLLLPEMGFSDWLAATDEVDPARWQAAVESHASYIAALSDLGAKAIVGTRPVTRTSGSRRNEAYVWEPDTGANGFHEKYYLPDEPGYFEHTWYDRGDKHFATARALDMRIGVQICTEMWFFDIARHYAKSKIDLLCVPRATPHRSLDRWLFGGQTAAVCAGAFALSSNLWRPVGDMANCGGMGFVIDPDGQVLAKTDQDNPFATVEIDLAKTSEAKATYPRYVPE